jgi:hypothetical protein
LAFSVSLNLDHHEPGPIVGGCDDFAQEVDAGFTLPETESLLPDTFRDRSTPPIGVIAAKLGLAERRSDEDGGIR